METTEFSVHPVSYRPRYASSLEAGVTWVICCLAFFSNSLTIVTMVKTRHGIGQKARLYIIALAVSDMVMVPTLILELVMSSQRYLFLPIFDVPSDPNILKYEIIGNITLGMMYFIGMSTSLFTLLAVAVDRLCALVRPLKYNAWITEFRIKILLLCIWVYFIFASFGIFVYSGLGVSPEVMLITFNPSDYLPVFMTTFILMPHMYIAVLGNATVYFIAYRRFKKIGILRAKNSSENKTKADEVEQRNVMRNRRFYRMVVASVGFQVLLWTPYTIVYNFVKINQPTTPVYITDYVQPFVYTVTICNSWINPILYSVLNSDYRKAYYRVLTDFRGNSNSVQSTTMP